MQHPGSKHNLVSNEQLWNKKYEGWHKPNLGEILGCASTKFRSPDGKIDKGKTRLYQILISEAAYLIWTLRCTRVIERDNERAKWAKKNQILNQLKYRLNLRLKMDCILTNERKFSQRALRPKTVLKTWGGLIQNEADLPNDWTKGFGVLVGIGLRADTILFNIPPDNG